LNLIVGLQIFTILVSHGDVLLLGEAYAFGVIWSFVLKSLAMLVLRFKRPGPRDFMVPGNVRIKGIEIPVGITLIFLVLLSAASVNLLTKPVATISGGIFSATLFAILMGSERFASRASRKNSDPAHRLEQFNVETADEFSPQVLKLEKKNRVLIGVRGPASLKMLEEYLGEVDPETTDVVVLTADVVPRRSSAPMPGLSPTDRKLFTKVVKLSEDLGKPVHPLSVPTDDPYQALARVGRGIGAGEILIGASRRNDDQRELDRLERAWTRQKGDLDQPVTLRIMGQGADSRRTVNPKKHA
jgi:hypothetical protein